MSAQGETPRYALKGTVLEPACMISSKRLRFLPPGWPTRKKASSASRSCSLVSSPVSEPCRDLSIVDNMDSMSSCSNA